MTALTGTLLPAVEGDKKQDLRKRGKVAKTAEQRRLTPAKWEAILGRVAAGENIKQAIKTLRVAPSLLEGHLISDKKAADQLADAKIKALQRIWSEDMVEEILVAIALGATVQQACDKVFMGDKIDSFYKLMLRDKSVKDAYDEARMIQAEKMAIDDIIEISDNTENDETFDGRPNSAAVNRDRLKVDSRKWIAGKLHYKRFGDKIQQEVEQNITIDHAARLEAARKRRDSAISKSKK
jgi:hypothetical protein